MSANANSASCQLSSSMPTIVAIDRRHVRGDRRRRVRDDALDAADVVRDPRLHLAGARAREEREREPLQVAEDRRAQVVHHALADLVREQRLDDAEHAGDDRDHDHPAGVDRERAVVVRCCDRLQDALAAGTPERRRAPAATTIRASRAVRRSLYGRKSGRSRRRFARRTAGSAGRSGASPGEWKNMPIEGQSTS